MLLTFCTACLVSAKIVRQMNGVMSGVLEANVSASRVQTAKGSGTAALFR